MKVQRIDFTPLEAAEKLESLIDYAGDTLDDALKFNLRKVVDTTASYLRAIAAGEYKPVVHARWKLVSEGARCNLVKCTHCGRLIAVARNVPLDEWRAAKPYCDQCGALMHKSDMGILQDGKD